VIGGRQHSEPLRSAAQIGDSSKTSARHRRRGQGSPRFRPRHTGGM